MSQTARRFQRLIFALLLTLISIAPIKAGAASVSYSYDLLGRVTTAVYDNSVCVIYTYDANGNRTAQTNSTGGAPLTSVWGTGVWGCAAWVASSGGLVRHAHQSDKSPIKAAVQLSRNQ